MMTNKFLRLTSATLLSTACGLAVADHKPLWELHLGIGTLQVPHYRGSASNHNYTLPLPTFTYRGEYIKSSEDGLKGLIFSSDRLSLDISMAMSLSASSDANDARSGMPRLAPTLELGPSLVSTLWQTENKQTGLWFKLPLRMAFSFDDLDVRDQGLIFSPYLQWRYKVNNWRWGAKLGVSYADEHYHNYFYEVKPQYVTGNRAEYHAVSGYSGGRASLSLTKHFKRSWFGAFIRFEDLNNTVFEDSPLVEKHEYLAFGLMYTHLIAKSSRNSSHSEHEID